MGRAVIVAHQGGALYEVRQKIDRSRADARIAQLQARLPLLDASLATAEVALAAALVVEQAAADALIVLAQADPPTPTDTLQAAQRALGAATEGVIRAGGNVAEYTLERAGTVRRIATLSQYLPAAVQPAELAWCADYTLDLAPGAEVSTIEVGRTRGDPLILYPGVDGWTEAGGQLRATMSLSSPAAYLACALLPGADKWRPRFRTGTVTAVDSATHAVDVTLDAAPSVAQALETNQTPTLSAVPTRYMGDAPSAVFLAGDHVVVAFEAQDWAQPHVIGFAHNPRTPYADILHDGLELSPLGDPPFTWTLTEDTHFTAGPFPWGTPYTGLYLSTWWHRPQMVATIAPKPGAPGVGVVSWPCWLLSDIDSDTVLGPSPEQVECGTYTIPATGETVPVRRRVPWTVANRGTCERIVTARATDANGLVTEFPLYVPFPRVSVGYRGVIWGQEGLFGQEASVKGILGSSPDWWFESQYATQMESDQILSSYFPNSSGQNLDPYTSPYPGGSLPSTWTPAMESLDAAFFFGQLWLPGGHRPFGSFGLGDYEFHDSGVYPFHKGFTAYIW